MNVLRATLKQRMDVSRNLGEGRKAIPAARENLVSQLRAATFCEFACLNAFVAQLMHQGIDAVALACAIRSDDDQCLGWVVGRARDG